MSLYHHFVVIVGNGKVSVDLETTDWRFEDSVWDSETQDWVNHKTVQEENDEAYELLASICDLHNDPRL